MKAVLMRFLSWTSILLIVAIPTAAFSDDSLLVDRNGDGAVSYLAFGDSITYGVGDGTDPGEEVEEIPTTNGTAGYPARLQRLLSIPVANRGVPGEVLFEEGIKRFGKGVPSTSADIVGIFEGANDASENVSGDEFERVLQKAINIATVTGKTPLLFTVLPPTAEHGFLLGETRAYSRIVRDLAFVNDLNVADVEHAWTTTCEAPSACELYNIPEGLHPNSKGYDVIAQTAAAALLGIDIFEAEGARDLEEALGLSPGTVVVKPDAE